MIFIYNCFGGSHSSVTAAAIHLAMLTENKIPTAGELTALPFYDAQVNEDHGRIRFMGYDRQGHSVYITSKRNLKGHYETIMRKVMEIGGIDQNDLVFIDTMPYVNIWMIVGGYLSRRLGFTLPGRKIVIYGTQQAFFKFVHLVRLIKARHENHCY